MKVPCCSVCHTRYDEGERIPLLLECGHGFCKACLTRMFSDSADTALSCPRCRHLTTVGNSVHALRKNFPILSLLSSSPSSPSFDCDITDDDDDDDDGGEDVDDDNNSHNENDNHGNDHDDDDFFHGGKNSNNLRRQRRRPPSDFAGCCSSPIDLGSQSDLKLLRQLAEGSKRPGQETWSAVLYSSSSGKCKHQVVVKRVAITEDMDVVGVQSKLEGLRQASMWCRNVCTFHGALRIDGHLCLVMDKYTSSIQAEMVQNKGRLTLEQIYRFYFFPVCFLLGLPVCNMRFLDC